MVLESLALPQSPEVRATILLTLGELAPLLPSNFHIEWSSMEWSFTGHLVKSVELSGLSNFDVYLQVQLSEEEGEQLLGEVFVDKAESVEIEDVLELYYH